MSAEEEIVTKKFILLKISKEDFDKLPVEDRIERLEVFRERYSIELSELLTRSGEIRRRIPELQDSIAGGYRVVSEYDETARRIERLRTEYRESVTAERREIGRLGAYSRWYGYFLAKRILERARKYSDLIVEQREKIFPLVADVARIRAELRALPRYERLIVRIDQLRSAISLYQSRLRDLEEDRTRIARRVGWITELTEEIDRELEELKVIPKIVRHRYREVSFAVTSHIEYESERRGGEVGHDIDIEIQLDFRIKSILPTRYIENEAGWLDEIQVMAKNEMCKLIRECSDEYILMPWGKIDAQIGWTCNIVGRRIVRRTIVNASKYYKDLVPPIPRAALTSILKRELERYSFISVPSISVTRANELRGEKTPCYGCEQYIRPCLERRSVEVIEEVISWDISEEIDELMRYLSE